MKRLLNNAILWCLVVCCGGLLSQSPAYAVARVESLDMEKTPGALRIGLSERTPFKVVKLDDRQFMVAFKSADISPEAVKTLSGDQLVKQVTIEPLPNQVVSLMIDTTEDISTIQADWQDNSETLLVRFVPAGNTPPKKIPVKRRKFSKSDISAHDRQTAEAASADVPSAPDPSPQPSPARTEETPPLPAMPPPPPTEPATETVLNAPALAPAANLSLPAPSSEPLKEDGLDGLIVEISRSECSRLPIVTDALTLCERKEWKPAFDLLSPALDSSSTDACQADLYYLRAFAAYRMNQSGSDRLYLNAVNYFQDAASYFSESAYTPYGLLALASIYHDMENYPEAKGYYNVILKLYAGHPVYAEALFHLGNLYLKENKQSQAIETFRKFVEEYPQSSRLAEVRLALGKCLYETNEFADALSMLRKVLEEAPAYVYKDPELLMYIGRLNYQLGNIESAREAMVKAVNLYPDSEAAPDILTRIADTFKNDNQTEQAKKIYQLVMEMYPGTDGFAVSAIRYAGLLSDRADKEAQYHTVIENFPGHPMAKLAMIRLADLQTRAGEYASGIDTLRGVMSGNLKDLQNEAAYAMEAAFDGFFRQLSSEEDPIAIISAYEKDKHLINRLDSPEIFERVGTAFFKAHLYKQAVELFQKSYKLSSPDNRSPSLYYRLGVTFQELGENMQAKEMFDAYFQKIPNEQIEPNAYLRMGRLLTAERSWESALSVLSIGIRKSESDLEKADFLIGRAEAYQGLGKEEEAPALLTEAINLMASSPDVRAERLMQVHRALGESYLKLFEIDKAIDAFTMALKFSTESRPPALLFLLAESNMKAHRSEAAKEVFLEIIDSGDDFWARMAQERLRAMELEAKLKE